MQKTNQQAYVQSKTALSKKVAESEREKKDLANKLETIKHKLEQTNAEKEVIKRQLDTQRTMKKQQIVNEIKQSKVPPPQLDTFQEPNPTNSLAGQRSPKFSAMSIFGAAKEKILVLKDARNERKIKK
jgi:septal ring factor EnvC (AmiA/AmiB activator)